MNLFSLVLYVVVMFRVACSLRAGMLRSSRGLGTAVRATQPSLGDAASTTSSARKPIILLDVDGVINMFENHAGRTGEWTDVSKGLAYNTERGCNYEVKFSKEMISCVNAWNKVAEVKWLTTWNDEAQTQVAPVMGLDHFECARTFKLQEDLDEEEKAKMAVRVAKDVGDDTLIIWIDDDMRWFLKRSEESPIFKRPNTLLLGPAGLLTKADIELVNACLADPLMWRGKHLRRGF